MLQLLAFAAIAFLVTRSLYRLFIHPLHSIPGPTVAKISSLWLYYHSYIGDEATIIHTLHTRYGPILRVSPHEVDISDPDALAPIYVLKGGFRKADCYPNFHIDEHATLFSTISNEHRAPRAKVVSPLFSTKAIRENTDKLYGCVDRFVNRLREEAKSSKGQPVNLLNLTRALAVDAVSTHLFAKNYDAVSERSEHLSMAAFVDAFVGVGRFFYLPTPVFHWVEWAIDYCTGDAKTAESMATVDRFVEDVVSKTSAADNTYPGRLMNLGLKDDETKAQCKDLIFAGTDSTGMNLATILRYLVLNPSMLSTIASELGANASKGADAVDIQALPYLTGVIKEGLRLSMANPTRLPRVVPSSGWTFQDTWFAPGTVVGCSAYELHFNPIAFPDPQIFRPERWIRDEETTERSENEKEETELNKGWFAFGAGSRQCIARNLATAELYMAVERTVQSGVLIGCQAAGEVKILEWFNSRVVGERVDVCWE
ncbi:cytochrome P450 [Pleomassaria siparia CBS 279.74]|uniref:Cytochrome P450 n=1 Tax=Pleomassaria siparia CBS 279.74 TaxID=1314801 RepID=A0A6G1JXN8_9PLEO|nr:cytochrome P450 [Pleomassaria siparia CBS 279.74]